MGQLIFSIVLSDKSGGVTSSDNDGGTLLLSFNSGIQERQGSLGKVGEFKDTGGSVPENGLGLENGVTEELVGLFTAVETHPVGLDTFLVGGGATFGIVGKVLGNDVV